MKVGERVALESMHLFAIYRCVVLCCVVLCLQAVQGMI